MKYIGFIDFYLDEWHASNYPAWIRESISRRGFDWQLKYAWAKTDHTDCLNSISWCKKYDMEYLVSIEELVEKCDFIIVLSPDNPEYHEELSRLPLESGKPVYIDKTFSSDLASGIRMFNTADKYGTPMFSSSALRFSKELLRYPDSNVNLQNLEYVATTGPGKYDNYSVHQLEMIVSLMGTGACRLKSLSSANTRMLVIEYGDGKKAAMLQMKSLPFQLSLQLKNGQSVFIENCSDMFPGLIDSILAFFDTRKPPVSREQTLEIMALIEGGYKAIKNYDKWIHLPQML